MSDVLNTALAQEDLETAVVVLRVLAGDPASRALRLNLAGSDPRVLVQRAALRSLMHESREVMETALGLLESRRDGADVLPIELEEAGVFRVALESLGPFPETQIQAWKVRLIALRDRIANESSQNAPDLRQAVAMVLEVLDTTGPSVVTLSP